MTRLCWIAGLDYCTGIPDLICSYHITGLTLELKLCVPHDLHIFGCAPCLTLNAWPIDCHEMKDSMQLWEFCT